MERLLGRVSMLTIANVRHNCYVAGVGKLKRKHYVRSYPTLLVFPDGSTITVRYHEPRQIIKLPLDYHAINAEERRRRVLERVMASQKKSEDEKDALAKDDAEDFDAERYSFMWKNKN